MKRTFTALLLLLSLAGTAQTKPGLYTGTTIATDNVKETPLVGNVQQELTYFNKIGGLGAVFTTDTRIKDYTMLGAKVYVNVWQIDEKIDTKLAFTANRYLDLPTRQKGTWQLKPEYLLNTEIYPNVHFRWSAFLDFQKYACGCELPSWKMKVGASAGIMFKL